KVLVTGGQKDNDILNSAELYDPSTETWTIIASMKNTREVHTASLLMNGQVLIAGGYMGNTTEIYDPSTNTWVDGSDMNDIRISHTASVLTNGKVLVTGGFGNVNYLSSAELYG
ncbi:unnamed protein product, partial [Adineta steineri]